MIQTVLEASIRFAIGNINLWSPAASLALGAFAVRREFRCDAWSRASLRFFCLLVLGVYGVLGFIEHLFFSEAVAALIGWPNSPFQYEVAYANLVFGVLGIWAFIAFDRRFVLACLVGFTVWFGCDGLGHVYALVVQGDRAPYNAGSTLYTDLLLPVMGWVLFRFGPPPAVREAARPGGGAA